MEESLAVPSEEEVEGITEKQCFGEQLWVRGHGPPPMWEGLSTSLCWSQNKSWGEKFPRASWWVSTTSSHPRMFCISTLLPCILHITMCSAPDFLMGFEGRAHVYPMCSAPDFLMGFEGRVHVYLSHDPSCTEPSTEEAQVQPRGLDEWTEKASLDSSPACPEISVDGFHSLACLETPVTPFLSCDCLSPTEATNSPRMKFVPMDELSSHVKQ